MPVTHSLKAGLIMLSVLCTQGCVINIEENQFEELDFNPQREMMGSFEPSQFHDKIFQNCCQPKA